MSSIEEKRRERATSKEEMNKISPKTWVVITIVAFIIVAISEMNKPDPCDCMRVLGKKKSALQYVPGMSDKEMKLWKKCNNEYAGAAGATLDCMGK